MKKLKSKAKKVVSKKVEKVIEDSSVRKCRLCGGYELLKYSKYRSPHDSCDCDDYNDEQTY
jgi:hypothetical protein